MTKKSKFILYVIGGLLVLALPIIYKKFDIPQSTQDSIMAFAMGMISQFGIQAAVKLKASKDDKKDG